VSDDEVDWRQYLADFHRERDRLDSLISRPPGSAQIVPAAASGG